MSSFKSLITSPLSHIREPANISSVRNSIKKIFFHIYSVVDFKIKFVWKLVSCRIKNKK